MKSTFLAAVAVLVSASVAGAQIPAGPHTLSQSCPGGVCPRAQAAATVVRSALAEVIVPPASGPVYGTWIDPTAQPWQVAPSASVPQRMAAPTCPPGGCPPALEYRPAPLVLPAWQPFGGQFRPYR